jgi:hypothetical protein
MRSVVFVRTIVPVLGCTCVLLLAAPAQALPSLPSLQLPGARGATPEQGVFPGGLLEVLPASGLVADGATAAELTLIALRADGTPVVGLAGVTPSSSAGTASALRDLGGGLYGFTFTPSRADAPRDVPVSLKAKLPDKSVLQGTWTLRAGPTPREALFASVSPPVLALGQDKSASVQLRLESTDPLGPGTAQLALRASMGTLGPVTALGDGQYTALYTPPADLAQPGIALITAADRRDPSRAYAVTAVPLQARQDLSLTPGKNTRVLVKVADREFGPVAADSAGRARVQVSVPPGTTEATLVTLAADGTTRETPLPLKVTEKRRLSWVPVAAAVPADPSRRVPVRVYVAGADGRPDELATVTLKASTGSVSYARHEGGGVYVADWTPGESNVAGRATLIASLEGGSAAQTDTLAVDVVPVRASAVRLTRGPAGGPAPAGPGNSFNVVAEVTSASGAPLAGRVLHVSANGAKAATPRDDKNGQYTIPLVTSGSGTIQVFARAGTPSANNPLDRLVLVTDRTRVAADGLSSVPVTVFALDAWGHPVANVTLDLSASGDGAIPTSATTGADGVAQVYYSAGRTHGLVRFEARYGPYTAAAGVVQAPDEVVLPDWRIGGPADARAEIEALAGSDGALTVERAR